MAPRSSPEAIELFLRSKEMRELHRVFSDSPYTPNVYFVSSNNVKICHMQHLFDLFSLPLRIYSRTRQAYPEDHNRSPEASLCQSVRYVAHSLEHLGVFFIEDSAFALDALSQEGREYPGLATKAFLRQYDIHALDNMLRSKGDDRRATLISRIALHLPGGFGVEVFAGKTRGTVAPPDVVGIPQTGVPWLDEKSPAHFFVPGGCVTPLSLLPLEVSYDYDTRLRAVRKLLFRLGQFLRVSEYTSTVLRRKPSSEPLKQGRLFPAPILVLAGHSGAGKTTAALYVSRRYGFRYLEESDAVRDLAEQLGCQDADLAPFCNSVVEHYGKHCFVKHMLEMHGKQLDAPLAISGVRTPEEVRYLRDVFPRAYVIFLDVPFGLRSTRCSLDRRYHPRCHERLSALEVREREWGIEQVREAADRVLRNTASLQVLLQALDKIVSAL